MAKAIDSNRRRTGVAARRIDAIAEWRAGLTGVTTALITFEILTGLGIYLLPFSLFNQFSVIAHTVAGIAMVLPVGWFVARHWWVRRRGNLSHFQLLGYISFLLLFICTISGLVLTWQSLLGSRIDYAWDWIHLLTGLALGLFVSIHLATVISRKVGQNQPLQSLRKARWTFYAYTFTGAVLSIVIAGVWSLSYQEPSLVRAFPDDYDWRFGDDRPFAPSLARIDSSQWQNKLQNQVL
ncbi:MAG: hypothetical protein ABFS45_23195, partial [Pseudomonadota bacterium]